jgi:hypothetical protein
MGSLTNISLTVCRIGSVSDIWPMSALDVRHRGRCSTVMHRILAWKPKGSVSSRYSLTRSWSWALLVKPPTVQLLRNFPAFYETRRFMTVFTRALHWSLSWARLIQSIPSHHISLRFILILSTHIRLGLSIASFLLAFPPISYIHSYSPPFVLRALLVSSFSTWSF